MPAGRGTYGSKKGRPIKKNKKTKAELFNPFLALGAPSEILEQKPRKNKKPDSKNISQKPRKPGTSKTKNAKPMTPVTSGNGTKGKLTAVQKTLPEFLKKKIKGSKKKN
tara:strand:- start:124 stop:450 length:327 start_codon:yes stop_codon:yes gene_type:complete